MITYGFISFTYGSVINLISFILYTTLIRTAMLHLDKNSSFSFHTYASAYLHIVLI